MIKTNLFKEYVRSACGCYWYHVTQYYLPHGWVVSDKNWEGGWLRHPGGLKTRPVKVRTNSTEPTAIQHHWTTLVL